MAKLKILLDECIDKRLTKEITQNTVKTVPQMGWAGLTNGALLSKAENAFDIFITNDQNLSFQQNLKKYKIAVLVLCPPSNRLQDLKSILRRALRNLDAVDRGKATFIK